MRIGGCHKTWELWQQWNVNLEVERQFRKETQYSLTLIDKSWKTDPEFFLQFFRNFSEISIPRRYSENQNRLGLLWDFEFLKVYLINSALKCRQVHQNSKNFPYF